MQVKSITALVAAIAFFLIAGNIRPAYAFQETLLDLTTSSYSENLEGIAPMASVICTKDKYICIRSIDSKKKEKEDEKKPYLPQPALLPQKEFAFKVKLVSSNTVLIPSQNPSEPKASLSADTMFDIINSYRTQNSLTLFQKDDQICSLADARSKELASEFYTGRLHNGLFNRNLPYYVTENAILGRSEEFAIQWWLASPIHRSQMFGNFTHSCIKCEGNACSQVFTSYIPKISLPQAASHSALLTN